MKNETTMSKARWVLVVSMIALCAAPLFAVIPPQEGQNDTRRLWDSCFIDIAKAAKKGTPKPVHKPKSFSPARINKTPDVPIEQVAPETVLGITLWRAQFSNGDTSRIPREKSAAKKAEEAEKRLVAVTADAIFRDGDLMRLTIEAARDGYLYVIARECYSDGSVSAPYLIFPNNQTGLENNVVKKNKAFDIPETYFEMESLSGRSVTVANELIVIAHPTRLLSVSDLEKLKFDDGIAELEQATVKGWEESWGSKAGRVESSDGVNQPFKRNDGKPGDTTRILREKDALPQTIYYKPNIKPHEPLLIKLRLKTDAAKGDAPGTNKKP